jgi:hypothetical protein
MEVYLLMLEIPGLSQSRIIVFSVFLPGASLPTPAVPGALARTRPRDGAHIIDAIFDSRRGSFLVRPRGMQWMNGFRYPNGSHFSIRLMPVFCRAFARFVTKSDEGNLLGMVGGSDMFHEGQSSALANSSRVVGIDSKKINPSSSCTVGSATKPYCT